MERTSTLGQRVRELRMKKGLTQIDLAKELCTPSMISQIESDRARPSYKMLFAIAERLDVPLDRLLMDVDLNMEYVSTYKMARAMVASKEYVSAIPLLQELLETPRTQISSMDILFELGECYLHTRDLEEAEKSFSKVQELAILCKDHMVAAQVLKNIGRIACERKKYQLASFQWQLALDEVEKSAEKDVYVEAEILSYLGEVHVKMGFAKEAADYFERAAFVYENHGSLQAMGRVYMGLGMSYKLMRDFPKAADYSERAAAVFESIENLLMSVKLEINNASLYAQIGRLLEAEDALTRSIGKLQDIGDKETQGIAQAELARVYLYRKEYEKAEETCQIARALLPELHFYQAKVNRTIAGISLGRGQTDEAIRRLQMAGDGFKRLDEAREYDDTMQELAELYRNQSDFQRMAEVLEKMRTFTREALTKRGIEL